MKYICLVSVLLLTGCAQHFTRPDYTEELLQKDWTECEVMAGQSGKAGTWGQKDFMRRCMIGKGWKAE